MTIQMKMNKKGEFDMFLIISIVLIILLISVVVIYTFKESKTDYEMPNGVICKNLYSGNTRIFSSCSDNQKYINPEYYREIKK